MGQKDTKETRELFVPITPRNNPSAVVISPSFAAVSRHSNSITDSFHLRLGLKTSTNQKTFQKQGASLRLEVAWKFQINAVFLGVLWSDVPGYCTLALGPDFICKDLKSRKLARCRPDMTWSWDRRITPESHDGRRRNQTKIIFKEKPSGKFLSVCLCVNVGWKIEIDRKVHSPSPSLWGKNCRFLFSCLRFVQTDTSAALRGRRETQWAPGCQRSARECTPAPSMTLFIPYWYLERQKSISGAQQVIEEGVLIDSLKLLTHASL